MRYSLYINQPVAIELGLENTTEAIIFDYLIIAPTWAEPIIIGKQVYYWVARQKICEEHPLLDLKTDTVYRYLKRLSKKGLISYIKQGKKDCVCITKTGKKYVSKAISENNPCSTPTTISEENPNTLGELSETARKKIRHINIPSYPSTKLFSSSKKKETFHDFRARIKNEYLDMPLIKGAPGFLPNTIISLSSTGYLHNNVNHKDLTGEDAKKIWTYLYSHPNKLIPTHKEINV